MTNIIQGTNFSGYLVWFLFSFFLMSFDIPELGFLEFSDCVPSLSVVIVI